jgi:DNA-binding transcriptional LysR family regulator
MLAMTTKSRPILFGAVMLSREEYARSHAETETVTCQMGIADEFGRIRSMELRHLRAFVAVAEAGTFTKAARRLHLSQPPLSKQIQQLERELGTALFVRRRDGIELTRDGAMLLDRAQAVLNALHEFEDSTKLVNSRERPLRIGIGWGLWDAVERIRAHHEQRFPQMRIIADDLCSERGRIAERQIDIAVTRPPVDSSRFESQALFEEQFVALLADTHPLASRKSVRLVELANEPLLMYDRSVGPGVYDKTLALFRAAGVQPPMIPAQPPPYAQGAMMLVASRQGYYVGIASSFTQTHRVSGVAVVPLDEPDARLEILIAWRKNETSRCVNEFVRSARAVFPRDKRRSGAA